MGWRIFGRMGIPFTVSAGGETAGTLRALCLTAPLAFSHDELRDLISGPLLLDGEAAWHLCEKGFGQHLGVEVRNASIALSAELLHVLPESSRKREVAVGMMGKGHYLLETNSPHTRIASSFVTGSKANYCKVAPALTWYENELGGRIAVYGLSMRAPLDWVFFNNKRKAQLIETLTWLADNTPPVVVETDLDVYVLYGKDNTVDRQEIICLFDLNPDTVEQVSIQLPGHPVRAIERLSMDGHWDPVAFSTEDQRIRCDADAPTMEPFILRLSR